MLAHLCIGHSSPHGSPISGLFLQLCMAHRLLVKLPILLLLSIALESVIQVDQVELSTFSDGFGILYVGVLLNI